jgi:lipoprotein NlpD
MSKICLNIMSTITPNTKLRHCERSEAIQCLNIFLDCFAALAMTQSLLKISLKKCRERRLFKYLILGIIVVIPLLQGCFFSSKPRKPAPVVCFKVNSSTEPYFSRYASVIKTNNSSKQTKQSKQLKQSQHAKQTKQLNQIKQTAQIKHVKHMEQNKSVNHSKFANSTTISSTTSNNTYHIVRPGETLFLVAARYKIDPQKLAVSNGIYAPYHLKTGQKLVLQPQKEMKKGDITKGALTTKISWRWPARGRIVRHFNESGKGKGLDIAGKIGNSINAASGGVVVYSGNGLKGYGNLIIIKHNEDFLSAYAHNQELRVKEGERVGMGQEIATMGQTDSEQVKVHFEIRYRGKPVDPLRYLPNN